MSIWRRITGRPAPGQSYTERHPLPPGWRPRTRIDVAGRLTEPWLYLIADAHGEYDGGELWLPVGMDGDMAAWEILQRWLSETPLGVPHRRSVFCAARPYGHSRWAGVAYAMDLHSAA